MKTFFTTLIMLMISLPAFSQLDVSINPIGLLFKSIGVSAEKPVHENIGLEGTLNLNFNKYSVDGEDFNSNGFGLRALGKYYFNPDKGYDKFNAGAYLRMSNNSVKYTGDKVKNFRLALGIYSGYKWVSKDNIIFELGLGVGRALTNNYKSDDTSFNAAEWPLLNFDITGKLAIGYRF
ncbi:DUF3575 domain-containing protein [Membranihabitans marinus]|uniref:DUF3575 domain-containing protein n=1 Tax=Membranihabitans marinus TaxID=1227546 RepID=UPI001F2D8ED5|nr:DUF3575 domain-containing protein [Membranihabitans marinus]